MLNKGITLNATLADLRGRVDTLAKSVFLIGGGSITLSVNLYLDKKELLASVIYYLKHSWLLLLLAIVLFALVIGLLIIQGFISSEFYRKKIENKEKINQHPKRYLDYIALIVGGLGFMSFISGMSYLILAAISL
jgi:hypothetical protein